MRGSTVAGDFLEGSFSVAAAKKPGCGQLFLTGNRCLVSALIAESKLADPCPFALCFARSGRPGWTIERLQSRAMAKRQFSGLLLERCSAYFFWSMVLRLGAASQQSGSSPAGAGGFGAGGGVESWKIAQATVPAAAKVPRMMNSRFICRFSPSPLHGFRGIVKALPGI
jgi:hypothetical protein